MIIYFKLFQPWTPTDFVEKPSLVDRVNDPVYKGWVISLNNVFRNLSRKVKDDVNHKPDLYSLLWVPNGQVKLLFPSFFLLVLGTFFGKLIIIILILFQFKNIFYFFYFTQILFLLMNLPYLSVSTKM